MSQEKFRTKNTHYAIVKLDITHNCNMNKFFSMKREREIMDKDITYMEII